MLGHFMPCKGQAGLLKKGISEADKDLVWIDFSRAPVRIGKMDPAEGIRHILEGHLEGLHLAGAAQGDVAERIATLAGLRAKSISPTRFEGLLERLHSRGQVLRALTLLKVLSCCCSDTSDLVHLLESIFERESLLDADEPFTVDPLATEFLGSDRPPVAWSVLCRDGLEIRTAPGPDELSPPDAWIVCRDERSISPEAPHGLALVWRTTTTVPGKLRPAGQRKICRKKMSLQGSLTFLGKAEKLRPTRKHEVYVVDISPVGAGLRLPNPHGWIDTEDLKNRRIRLEISLPAESRVLLTLADVVWCRPAEEIGDPVLRLGIHFHEPPQEFVQSVRELIIQRKGDQQLLWNLWDTQAPKR